MRSAVQTDAYATLGNMGPQGPCGNVGAQGAQGAVGIPYETKYTSLSQIVRR